jgi:branched-chain amino acid aminotransferase
MKIVSQLPPVKELGFGKFFAPQMALSHFSGKQWKPWSLVPSDSFTLSPAAKVLHYAQEIFEGLKAYRQPNGNVVLFRPHANIQRMTRSADLMAMPAFPEDIFLDILKKLTLDFSHLVPETPGSFYLRPTMIGMEPTLGVAPSQEYCFYVLGGPVGGYFGITEIEKPASVNILITETHVRAAPGGVGAAKTGANYAASLRAVNEAKKIGYSNVCFLDAIRREHLEELSGMNVFIVDQGVLKTPKLGDTILQGVTRDSLIQIAPTLGLKVVECDISAPQMIRDIQEGKVTEVFACGTAATVTNIGELGFRGDKIRVGTGSAGPIGTRLYQQLVGIQTGKIKAPSSDWIVSLQSL